MWVAIDGREMSIPDFQWHVQNLRWGKWRPIGIVWHNTASPTLAQWKQHPRSQWLTNLASYYKGLGWHAGPHLFIDHEKINLFTPLTEPGVHSPSFNSQYIGIEHVGDFAVESPDNSDGLAVKKNGIAATAILCQHLGIPITRERIKLHKEDPRTTHDCPGKLLAAEVDHNVQLVADYITHGGEHAPDWGDQVNPANPQPAPPSLMGQGLTTAVGVNLRAAPSRTAEVLATLDLNRPVDVYGHVESGDVEWLHIKLPDKPLEGWVAARYVKPIQ